MSISSATVYRKLSSSGGRSDAPKVATTPSATQTPAGTPYDPPWSSSRFVFLSTQQYTWTIADGPEENTVTLGAAGPGPDMPLGPVLAYQPLRVALLPREDYFNRGWALYPA